MKTQKCIYMNSKAKEVNNFGSVKIFHYFEDFKNRRKFYIIENKTVKYGPKLVRNRIYTVTHDKLGRAFSIEGDYIKVENRGSKIIRTTLRDGVQEWVNSPKLLNKNPKKPLGKVQKRLII